MKKIVLIAGYTKLSHTDFFCEYFKNKDVIVACVYSRAPRTETKMKYLEKFDMLFNLQQPSDVEKLQHSAEQIELMTCTQERDMDTYITALHLCGKISDQQEKLYRTLIDKHEMKISLAEKHPELVPETQIIDQTLLQKLETLDYPQVIKPDGLAGSILVRIVHSPEEFQNHYDLHGDTMRFIATENYEKEIDIITEEYISGPQYSVNVYIDQEQNITYCPISRVVTPQEMGEDDSYSALQYITNELTETQFDALTVAVSKAVTHFDIRSTSAHFDSVLHESGWKFFEIGLRIGGNRQELYSISHDMNHFKNDLLNRLGKKVIIPPQKKTVCIIQKASTAHGVLAKISYTREIASEKSPMIKEAKMAKIGSNVKPLKVGGGTITRHFMWGEHEEEVVEASRKLFHSITFEIL